MNTEVIVDADYAEVDKPVHLRTPISAYPLEHADAVIKLRNDYIASKLQDETEPRPVADVICVSPDRSFFQTA